MGKHIVKGCSWLTDRFPDDVLGTSTDDPTDWGDNSGFRCFLTNRKWVFRYVFSGKRGGILVPFHVYDAGVHNSQRPVGNDICI